MFLKRENLEEWMRKNIECMDYFDAIYHLVDFAVYGNRKEFSGVIMSDNNNNDSFVVLENNSAMSKINLERYAYKTGSDRCIAFMAVVTSRNVTIVSPTAIATRSFGLFDRQYPKACARVISNCFFDLVVKDMESQSYEYDEREWYKNNVDSSYCLV